MLWQSRLPQRKLPGADHHHYDDSHYHDFDYYSHNLDFDYYSHDLDFDYYSHDLDVDDDAYVPTERQRLQHQRHCVL